MRNIYFITTTAIAIAMIIAGTFITQSGETQQGGLKFSHAQHVLENELECIMCHEGAESSTSGTDDLLPKEEVCLTCHEKTEDNCIMCHTNPENIQMIPRIDDYNPLFSHAKHAEEGYSCDNCHEGVSESKTIEEQHLPDMASCMECHEVPEDLNECYVCHVPDFNLEPESHTELWVSNHGSFMASEGKDCETCHTEDYCVTCHLGQDVFAEAHPPEFMITHSVSYMMRESDCASCHGGFDYCIECHMEVNYIIPVTHSVPNWRYQHTIEGRVNSDQCVVCHRGSDPTCMVCHDYLD